MPEEHKHILQRATRTMYACIDDCSYRESKNFLIGRIVRCPFCKSEFRLMREDLRRVLPRCSACSDTSKQKIANELDAILGGSTEKPSEKITEVQQSMFDEKVGF